MTWLGVRMRGVFFLVLMFVGVGAGASSAKENMEAYEAEQQKVNALAGCGVAFKMLADITGDKNNKLSVAEIEASAQETIVASRYSSLVGDKYQESLRSAQSSLQSGVDVAAAIGGTSEEYAIRIVKVAEPYIKKCLPYMQIVDVKGGGTVFVRKQ